MMWFVWDNMYSPLVLILKAVPMELQIHHIDNQNGNAMFEVSCRMDMKCTTVAAFR